MVGYLGWLWREVKVRVLNSLIYYDKVPWYNGKNAGLLIREIRVRLSSEPQPMELAPWAMEQAPWGGRRPSRSVLVKGKMFSTLLITRALRGCNPVLHFLV